MCDIAKYYTYMLNNMRSVKLRSFNKFRGFKSYETISYHTFRSYGT